MTTTKEEGAEYRIDFSVMRRLPGEDDFSEVGFGSTTAEESVRAAGDMAHASIQNDEWDEVSQ